MKDSAKRKSSSDNFRIKTNSPARALAVEGFANKAVVDRGGDLIPPEAWQLQEFKNNNILLFNHNQDIAIGTADVKVTDQGLMAKAKISKSNEAPLPYIRDMIKEGVIKSFSVGFDAKDSAEKSEDGTHTVLKQANLLELSIVTVPMNQESTFSVSNAVDKCVTKWKTKSYSYHQARNDMLLLKGAFLARVIHDRIAQLQNDKSDFDRDEVIDKILEDSGSTEKILDDVLAGNTTGISDALLTAIATNLNLNPEELRSFSKEPDGKALPDPEEGKEGDKEKEEEKSEPEAEAADPEAEKSSDAVDEDEDKLKDDKAKDEEKNFQQCVSEKIPILIQEGRSQEEAVAIAISQCEEKFDKNNPLTTADLQLFIKIADESPIPETKQDEPTVNIDATSDLVENALTSNPTMDQMKAQTTLMAQQNGLLTDLIAEFRGLRSDLQNEKSEPEPPVNTDESEGKSETGDLDAKADRMAKYLKKLSEIEKIIA